MDCKEIIIKYLKDNKFDGLLCAEVPCGCSIDDLAPCDGNMFDCIPAYKKEANCIECNNTCDGYDDNSITSCFTEKNQ